MKAVSRIICALAFIAAGLNHFINPQTYCKIMPAYLPFPLELVFLSGVFEIAGGFGLFFGKTRNFAVLLLILLLIAVFPANINMALNSENFAKIPAWLLYLRLPLQAVIALWVWSCRLEKEIGSIES